MCKKCRINSAHAASILYRLLRGDYNNHVLLKGIRVMWNVSLLEWVLYLNNNIFHLFAYTIKVLDKKKISCIMCLRMCIPLKRLFKFNIRLLLWAKMENRLLNIFSKKISSMYTERCAHNHNDWSYTNSLFVYCTRPTYWLGIKKQSVNRLLIST